MGNDRLKTLTEILSEIDWVDHIDVLTDSIVIHVDRPKKRHIGLPYIPVTIDRSALDTRFPSLAQTGSEALGLDGDPERAGLSFLSVLIDEATDDMSAPGPHGFRLRETGGIVPF